MPAHIETCNKLRCQTELRVGGRSWPDPVRRAPPVVIQSLDKNKPIARPRMANWKMAAQDLRPNVTPTTLFYDRCREAPITASICGQKRRRVCNLWEARPRKRCRHQPSRRARIRDHEPMQQMPDAPSGASGAKWRIRWTIDRVCCSLSNKADNLGG